MMIYRFKIRTARAGGYIIQAPITVMVAGKNEYDICEKLVNRYPNLYDFVILGRL